MPTEYIDLSFTYRFIETILEEEVKTLQHWIGVAFTSYMINIGCWITYRAHRKLGIQSEPMWIIWHACLKKGGATYRQL